MAQCALRGRKIWTKKNRYEDSICLEIPTYVHSINVVKCTCMINTITHLAYVETRTLEEVNKVLHYASQTKPKKLIMRFYNEDCFYSLLFVNEHRALRRIIIAHTYKNSFMCKLKF
ncbi:hypothetical protein F2P56_021716 [Juglans regia]|uniref:Uncharacterized protein n=1 Tax=Juglans regia TaxID=51240 RepID=A0A833X329_JUGRE|nr:hypothetical protein F2P56_021716 [Juglans regia]